MKVVVATKTLAKRVIRKNVGRDGKPSRGPLSHVNLVAKELEGV